MRLEAVNLLRELRARRTRIRQAVECLPILGPVILAAFRKSRTILRDRSRLHARRERKPKRFLALYMQRHDIADPDNIADPVKRLHAEFALSTVARGRTVVERIDAHSAVRGKSYLDVGCAYGGFLVAFAQAGARRVVGIDLDARLLDYAHALLKDHRISAEVKHVDVLDGGHYSDLGRFDVITCNDVIEHVLDPARALERLGALLADGGMLYFEIPNRWSAAFVLADGHFLIFGLTVLPKRKADRYYGDLRGLEHDVTYKSLPFYINHLAKLGFATHVVRSTPPDLAQHFERIAATFAECERRLNTETNPSLAAASGGPPERSIAVTTGT